jgi:D-serine deaminase-like pyridoxal phosphate-dependent protein
VLKSTSKFLQKLGFTSPGILVDEDQGRANIRAMAEKAKRAGAVFRPHFKTHQSHDVGRWFADEGVRAITVSSVEMAEYFAAHGWHDITIAFLLNPLEWPRVERLARKLAKRGGELALTVDSAMTAAWLADRSGVPVGVWIKIDTGYGRTGVWWQDRDTVKSILDSLDGKTPVRGLLNHSGDSYQAQSPEEFPSIWDRTLHRMHEINANLGRQLSLSVGDTPCCHFLDDLAGVQELRPGNFVFFDLMQWSRGVCETRELAAAAVCPVVGIYPDRGQIVIHGGAVHLSKESLITESGQTIFGYLGTIQHQEDGTISKQVLTSAPLLSLSQEHGTIEIPLESREQFLKDLEIGDLVLVWPVHSCLTCDLASEYRTMSGSLLEKK